MHTSTDPRFCPACALEEATFRIDQEGLEAILSTIADLDPRVVIEVGDLGDEHAELFESLNSPIREAADRLAEAGTIDERLRQALLAPFEEHLGDLDPSEVEAIAENAHRALVIPVLVIALGPRHAPLVHIGFATAIWLLLVGEDLLDLIYPFELGFEAGEAEGPIS